jgi:hypothetical protein
LKTAGCDKLVGKWKKLIKKLTEIWCGKKINGLRTAYHGIEKTCREQQIWYIHFLTCFFLLNTFLVICDPSCFLSVPTICSRYD